MDELNKLYDEDILLIRTHDGGANQVLPNTKWGMDYGNIKNLEFMPVCFIRKLSHGRVEVNYCDIEKIPPIFYNKGDELIPNSRKVYYPSGIKHIEYKKKTN